MGGYKTKINLNCSNFLGEITDDNQKGNLRNRKNNGGFSEMKYLVLIFLFLLVSSCTNADYRALQYGDMVTCSESIVIGEFTDDFSTWDDCFYIKSPDSPNGIRVKSQYYAYEGDVINIIGMMSTNSAGQPEILVYDYANLASGYPMSRAYGINLKDLNYKIAPKGSLVRVWGNVTEESTQQYPLIDYFKMSDGPKKPTDNPEKYIKAYDSFHPHTPEDGTFAITGILDTENGEPVIYQSYNGFDLQSPRGPGRFNLSGKLIVDPLASGLNAKFYSDNACISTVVLDENGEANYTLSLPEGIIATNICIPGYHSQLVCGDISHDYSNIEIKDFYQTYLNIHVTPNSDRVSPGQSKLIVATCLDTEGKLVPGRNIEWYSKAGTIVSIDEKTDANGVARATYIAGTNKEADIVSASVEYYGIGGAWVFIANPGDPRVIINYPYDGEDLSGVIPLDIFCDDMDIVDSLKGIANQELLVDGIVRGIFFINEEDKVCTFDTSVLSNGLHILQARVTDHNGNSTESNKVLVNTYNRVSAVSLNKTELFTNSGEPLVFSAKTDGTTRIAIINCRDNSIISDNYVSGDINITWDGKINGVTTPGIYKIEIYDDLTYQYSAQAESIKTNYGFGWNIPSKIKASSEVDPEILDNNSSLYFTVTPDWGSALICGILRGEPKWSKDCTIEEMIAVMDACLKKHVSFRCIIDPIWASAMDNKTKPAHYRYGMDYWLPDQTRYFYLSAHATNQLDIDGVYRTYIHFADGKKVAGDSSWILTGETPLIYHAFSNLDLLTGYMQIAQGNFCYSAGCWTVPDYSIAKGLGIRRGYLNGCYIGWKAMYRPTNIANGTGWTKGLWKRLANGMSVSQAIDSLDKSTDISEVGLMSGALRIVDDESATIAWLY